VKSGNARSIDGEISHRYVSDDLADVVQSCELVGVEVLVRLEVGDFHTDQVVEIACDVVTFNDFDDLAHSLLEALDMFALMANEADSDEGGEPTVISVRVNDRSVTADYLLFLKTPESTRTG
jgi:hypothetical protein